MVKDISGTGNILLMCRYDGNYISAKIHYYKLYDNSTGNLNHNLIPCYRKTDNEAGLYDVVNGIFYTNKRTGSFGVGPNGCFQDPNKTQTIPYGVETKLEANTFTKAGYTFAGWNTKADGTGDSYTDQQAVTLTGDLELFAQWTFGPLMTSSVAQPKSTSSSSPSSNNVLSSSEAATADSAESLLEKFFSN